MRISDWSSDLCSSDLFEAGDLRRRLVHAQAGRDGAALASFMAKTLLFGGVLGQFHPCEHEQQALWLGLATGGVQEIPEIGEAHAACVMVIGAKLARTTSEGGRAPVAPRVRMERSGAGRGVAE